MVRVLQIVSSMNRGGLETYLMEIYRKLDKSKIQFDFLVHNENEGAYEKEIRELGGKIFRVCSRRKNIVKNISDLEKFFKEHQEYKIVHMHESSMSYITPLVVARVHKVPIIIMHSRNNAVTTGKMSIILHYFHRLMQNYFITDFFSISYEAAVWMFGKRKANSGKVRILKNGIDTDKFRFDSIIRAKMRNELGYDDENIVLGHVGRFSKQKNHVFLINIFTEIHKIDKRYRLLLIGNGAEKEKIKKMIYSRNLNDFVIVIDAISNVNDYYNSMDIFVLPSLFEGWGRVLVEAQCNGLPVIATEGTIPQSVKILDTFKFVKLNDEDWTNAIIKMMTKRTTNSEIEIKNNGYDIKNNADELQTFYLDVIKRRT